MAHDVNISLTKKIGFPPICVACGKQNPESQVELSFLEARFSVFEAASTVLTGSTYHLDNLSHTFRSIPACGECARQLKAQHSQLKLISYMSWALSVILAFTLPVSIGWKIAVFFVFLILPVALSIVLPPAFDVTISKGVASFYFRSRQVADAFREENEIQKP